MATKAGRAQLKDLRQGRTLWEVYKGPTGLAIVRREIHIGRRNIRGCKTDTGQVIQGYSTVPIHHYPLLASIPNKEMIRTLHPDLNYRVIRHRDRLHLINLFVSHKAAKRFIERHRSNPDLANAECYCFHGVSATLQELKETREELVEESLFEAQQEKAKPMPTIDMLREAIEPFMQAMERDSSGGSPRNFIKIGHDPLRPDGAILEVQEYMLPNLENLVKVARQMKLCMIPLRVQRKRNVSAADYSRFR